MPRKDSSEKDSTAIVTVNIDDFTRTRDSVIVSLASLQSAVSDLSRAYINHANTVLNRGPANLDLGAITTNLYESGLLGGGAPGLTQGAGAGAGAKEAGEGKKKRKRAPPDPNAPKRALTPYFLYMQHNRAAIAKELGADAKPKDVSDEGTRRWTEMPDNEKQVWKKLYADNLAAYHEKVKAYKAGRPIPEDEETEAARQLQQGVHHATEEASSSESSEDEEEEEEEASPEPAKAKTPPRSSKRRRSEAKAATPPPPSSAKKGKKSGKKEESVKKAVETPKTSEKKGRKKRKSEAHEE